MLPKKEISDKIVHRFTDNAHMRFRPANYNLHQSKPDTHSFTTTISNILGDIFKTKNVQPSNKNISNHKLNKSGSRGLSKTRSSIIQRPIPNASFIEDKNSQINIQNSSLSRNSSVIDMSGR